MRDDEALWEQGVAVIGMSGRFPGADHIPAFWELLREGKSGIRFFSEEELQEAGVPEALYRLPQYVKAKGMLQSPAWFDAAFFGMRPREAEWTDPQQRLFLECAYEALEDAAYVPDAYPGRIGVYGGCSMSTYLLNGLLQEGQVAALGDMTALMIGNDKDFLTSRVSYKLNLRGPSVTVQTACSSSLVAVHLACQSLLGGECDMALAGGSSVTFPNASGYRFQEGMILSPDGRCRAFDRGAQGTVPGNGAGVVVLKRLERAAEDGDFIYAVIRGSAVNNDGRLKAGFTAPSPDGQAEVIADALAVAGVHPESVSYVEAHGTGTAVGDPIELAGLTRAYRQWTSRSGFCAIGSVKTNVGHLDSAAGVTGLIKTVLALHHRQLPPSLHYGTPNPQIDFVHSPFYVNAHLTDWDGVPFPRRAGVSSFGIGATNAHVVLEEAPELPRSTGQRPWHTVLVSAKSKTALTAATRRLADYMFAKPDTDLDNVAYTTQVGRTAYAYRRAVVCRGASDAAQWLTVPLPLSEGRASGGAAGPAAFQSGELPPASAWLFLPWAAADWPGLTELSRTEPLLRRMMREALLAAEAAGGPPLHTFAAFFSDGAAAPRLQPPHTARERTVLSLAASYSLASTLSRLGLEPALVGGEAEGELAAACFAGRCTLAEAFRLALGRADGEAGGGGETDATAQRSVRWQDGRLECLPGATYRIPGTGTAAPRAASASGPGWGIPDAVESPLWGMLEAALAGRRRVVGLGGVRSGPADRSEFVPCFDACSWSAVLAALWTDGEEIDWSTRYSAEKRQRVPLPAYPFERQLYEVRSSTGASRRSISGLSSVMDGFPRHSATIPSGFQEGSISPKEAFDPFDLQGDTNQGTRVFSSNPSRSLSERQGIGVHAGREEEEEENPRRILENMLLSFHRDVLGLPEIGLDDRFYDLGGDSLSKMQVISRIEQAFAVPFDMRRLYETQTVAELADAIELSMIEMLDHDQTGEVCP